MWRAPCPGGPWLSHTPRQSQGSTGSCLPPCVLQWEKVAPGNSSLAECKPPRAIAWSCLGKSMLTLVGTFRHIVIHLCVDSICIAHIPLAWIGKKSLLFPSIFWEEHILSHLSLWKAAKSTATSPTPLRALLLSWVQRPLVLDYRRC